MLRRDWAEKWGEIPVSDVGRWGERSFTLGKGGVLFDAGGLQGK